MTQRIRPNARPRASAFTAQELKAMPPGSRVVIPTSDGRYLPLLRLDTDDPRDAWLIMMGQKIRSSVLADLAAVRR